MVAARLVAVGFVTLLLQVVVVSKIELFDAKGNIVLLFAIAAALESDAERGALVGFTAGLTFDLLLDTPAGLSALSMALVGWTVGSLKDVILRSSSLITLGLVGLASAGGTLLYAGLAVVFGVTVDPGTLPAIVVVISAVNVLLSKPMRWAVRHAFGPDPRAAGRDRSIFR